MKIGLWSDCHNFPSLPLMKISAYHKQRGDVVDFVNHLEHYDIVYASKVFSFSMLRLAGSSRLYMRLSWYKQNGIELIP